MTAIPNRGPESATATAKSSAPQWVRTSLLDDSEGNQFKAIFVKVPNVSDYIASGEEPALFAASDGNRMILVSGRGEVYLQSNLSANIRENKWPELKPVESNLTYFFDGKLYKVYKKGQPNIGWFSVKGVLLHKGEVFLSYSRKHGEACWNTGILKGLIIGDKIEFSDFWGNAECAKEDALEFNANQSGGAMVYIGADHVLFAEGDYRQTSLSQDSDSIFGKILSIEGLGSYQTTKILAKGLRNPQGMVKVQNEIFITDQGPIYNRPSGPKGGDEVNIYDLNVVGNSQDVNFGWPIASDGVLYDTNFRADASLYESHEKFGFTEPAIYYVPSIATSSITSVDFKVNGKEVLAIGALAGKSIHFVTKSGENKLEPVSNLDLKSSVRTVSKGPDGCILASLDTSVALICKVE